MCGLVVGRVVALEQCILYNSDSVSIWLAVFTAGAAGAKPIQITNSALPPPISVGTSAQVAGARAVVEIIPTPPPQKRA